MNPLSASLVLAVLFSAVTNGLGQAVYPYDPVLPPPPIVYPMTGGVNTGAGNHSTALPISGPYDYLATGVYQGNQEGSEGAGGSCYVDFQRRAPNLIFQNANAAPSLTTYRIYRKGPGETHHCYLSTVTRTVANFDGFTDDGSLTPDPGIIAPGEALAMSTPATGYAVTSAKGQIYQGDLFSAVLTPRGHPPRSSRQARRSR